MEEAPHLTIELYSGLRVKISPQDEALIAQHKWTYIKPYPGFIYAISTRKPRIYMHRLIMGANERSIQVDHKNHDGLDNRRSNLRLCTQSQNMANLRKPKTGKSSIYKGVYRQGLNKHKPWLAAINRNGKSQHIGLFPTQEEAALAYNQMAIMVSGEFALINDL